MRALVLEELGRLSITELEDPIAQSDEVLVRTIATGICGSDIHGYTGENGRRVPGQVMGHETVGTIEAIGPKVARPDLEVGALVTVNPVILPASNIEEFEDREQHDPMKRILGVAPDFISAFAEKIAVPARNIVPLPPGMPALHGALVEPLAVAVNAVRRVQARAGDVALILGGGPIGQSIVLALQRVGVVEIVVSEPIPSRRELLRRLGVHVVDPVKEPVPEAVVRLHGRSADFALDAVGISDTLGEALAATRLGANVCLVGMGAPRVTMDAFAVSTAERSIIGSFTYANRDFEVAAAWLGHGPTGAAELISRCVSMEEADAAFSALAAGDDTAGKVMVILDPDQTSL